MIEPDDKYTQLRQQHAHNHTHAEQTKELHCTKFVIFVLEIMTFSDLRVGSCFLKKYHYFIYVSFRMYSMTICEKSGSKAVDNYKNKDFVITRGRQNVTSTSTPSGPLTSYVLHATR